MNVPTFHDLVALLQARPLSQVVENPAAAMLKQIDRHGATACN